MAQINSLKSLNKESPDTSKSDLYSVAPHLLMEEDGFNTRGMYCDDYYELPEVKAGIRLLAEAYTRGDYVPPIIVKVRDGNVYVREGHRRRRAILMAIEEGAEIRKVQVLEHKGDEAEQSLLIATSNDGLPLTPLERAVIYGRLSKWGWSDQEIATRVGRTVTHVRNGLQLLELPLDLKKMIQAGEVSATYAAELYGEHGDNTIDVLRSAQDQTGSGGDEKPKKVTRKKVQPSGPKLGKRVVDAMHKSVSTLTNRLDSIKVQGETYVLTLTKDEVDELVALREKLAALDPAPEAKANQIDMVL